MTLRGKILIYVIALHAVLAGAAFAFLLEQTDSLFAVEALFLLSVLISIRLVRVLFVPLDLVQTGAQLIAERDFTSRLVPVGQAEMDVLIDVYNRMIDRLREERLAAEERHQLLQKIVQASPAGIVICDFDGRIELMNPAAERVMTTELRAQFDSIPPGESRLLTHLGARRMKVSRAEFRDRGFAKTFFVIEEMTEELRVSEKSAYEKLI
ncbi:MAG TPA: HAMP domain-containing protein, partial [Thermoanaerobaculia bacterium]|nr:HAMP domain-containing protein [Thermoanaerobaculia bacterium]